MKDEPLINADYYKENVTRLSKFLFFPLVLTFSGILLLIFLENSLIRGLEYLFLFLVAVLSSLFGSIKSFSIIIKLMKKDWKENKIHERTADYMRNSKPHQVLYWSYGIFAILGLIAAVITGNEDDLSLFSPLLVLGIIIFEVYRRIRHKSDSKK